MQTADLSRCDWVKLPDRARQKKSRATSDSFEVASGYGRQKRRQELLPGFELAIGLSHGHATSCLVRHSCQRPESLISQLKLRISLSEIKSDAWLAVDAQVIHCRAKLKAHVNLVWRRTLYLQWVLGGGFILECGAGILPLPHWPQPACQLKPNFCSSYWLLSGPPTRRQFSLKQRPHPSLPFHLTLTATSRAHEEPGQLKRLFPHLPALELVTHTSPLPLKSKAPSFRTRPISSVPPLFLAPSPPALCHSPAAT